MITASDTAIVQSLLNKAQSISRELSEDAAARRIPGTKRLSAKEWETKVRLFHRYVTVAIRYMMDTQS